MANIDDFTNTLRTRRYVGDIITKSSSCDLNNWHTCADAVDFNTQQWVYDHPLIPKDAAGCCY